MHRTAHGTASRTTHVGARRGLGLGSGLGLGLGLGSGSGLGARLLELLDEHRLVNLLVDLGHVSHLGDALGEPARRDGLVRVREAGVHRRHHHRLTVAAERVAQHLWHVRSAAWARAACSLEHLGMQPRASRVAALQRCSARAHRCEHRVAVRDVQPPLPLALLCGDGAPSHPWWQGRATRTLLLISRQSAGR